MTLGILGKKVGMTQVFDDKGKSAPVTVLALGPCPVLQVRTLDKDGYNAVQLGFQDKERRKANRAERGHVASAFSSKRRTALQAAGVTIPPKANCEPQRYIREFRLEAPSDKSVGALITANDIVQITKKKEKKGKEEIEVTVYPRVDVIGTTKGRGFTGVMKRHNFDGLPAAHGAKKVHRSGGSIGSHASNRGSGRPKKGHKAAGQYGNTRRTVRNLEVVRIDSENNLVLVRGAVPGPNGGFVIVRPTNKRG